jgi:trimethylamine:corrinoid methyltransferase-like protein
MTGCRTWASSGPEKQKVYYPPQVIEEALKKAPATYTLWPEIPENDLPLTTKVIYPGRCGNRSLT